METRMRRQKVVQEQKIHAQSSIDPGLAGHSALSQSFESGGC